MDEPQIFDPWNPNCSLIQEDEVNSILKKHNIEEEITNIDIYQRAFIHKSYIKKYLKLNQQYENTIVEKPPDCLDLQEKSYETLEYLGDAILSATIASYLFERFPDEDEGFLTRMRTKLVNGEMLGHLAGKMNLEKHLVISKQVLEKNDNQVSYKLLEDIFEVLLLVPYI